MGSDVPSTHSRVQYDGVSRGLTRGSTTPCQCAIFQEWTVSNILDEDQWIYQPPDYVDTTQYTATDENRLIRGQRLGYIDVFSLDLRKSVSGSRQGSVIQFSGEADSNPELRRVADSGDETDDTLPQREESSEDFLQHLDPHLRGQLLAGVIPGPGDTIERNIFYRPNRLRRTQRNSCLMVTSPGEYWDESWDTLQQCWTDLNLAQELRVIPVDVSVHGAEASKSADKVWIIEATQDRNHLHHYEKLILVEVQMVYSGRWIITTGKAMQAIWRGNLQQICSEAIALRYSVNGENLILHTTRNGHFVPPTAYIRLIDGDFIQCQFHTDEPVGARRARQIIDTSESEAESIQHTPTDASQVASEAPKIDLRAPSGGLPLIAVYRTMQDNRNFPKAVAFRVVPWDTEHNVIRRALQIWTDIPRSVTTLHKVHTSIQVNTHHQEYDRVYILEDHRERLHGMEIVLTAKQDVSRPQDTVYEARWSPTPIRPHEMQHILQVHAFCQRADSQCFHQHNGQPLTGDEVQTIESGDYHRISYDAINFSSPIHIAHSYRPFRNAMCFVGGSLLYFLLVCIFAVYWHKDNINTATKVGHHRFFHRTRRAKTVHRWRIRTIICILGILHAEALPCYGNQPIGYLGEVNEATKSRTEPLRQVTLTGRLCTKDGTETPWRSYCQSRQYLQLDLHQSGLQVGTRSDIGLHGPADSPFATTDTSRLQQLVSHYSPTTCRHPEAAEVIDTLANFHIANYPQTVQEAQGLRPPRIQYMDHHAICIDLRTEGYEGQSPIKLDTFGLLEYAIGQRIVTVRDLQIQTLDRAIRETWREYATRYDLRIHLVRPQPERRQGTEFRPVFIVEVMDYRRLRPEHQIPVLIDQRLQHESQIGVTTTRAAAYLVRETPVQTVFQAIRMGQTCAPIGLRPCHLIWRAQRWIPPQVVQPRMGDYIMIVTGTIAHHFVDADVYFFHARLFAMETQRSAIEEVTVPRSITVYVHAISFENTPLGYRPMPINIPELLQPAQIWRRAIGIWSDKGADAQSKLVNVEPQPTQNSAYVTIVHLILALQPWSGLLPTLHRCWIRYYDHAAEHLAYVAVQCRTPTTAQNLMTCTGLDTLVERFLMDFSISHAGHAVTNTYMEFSAGSFFEIVMVTRDLADILYTAWEALHEQDLSPREDHSETDTDDTMLIQRDVRKRAQGIVRKRELSKQRPLSSGPTQYSMNQSLCILARTLPPGNGTTFDEQVLWYNHKLDTMDDFTYWQQFWIVIDYTIPGTTFAIQLPQLEPLYAQLYTAELPAITTRQLTLLALEMIEDLRMPYLQWVGNKDIVAALTEWISIQMGLTAKVFSNQSEKLHGPQ